MPEESASIRLDFPELDHKIAQLKELLGVLQEFQGLGSGGMVGGAINPKTLPGTSIATAPQQTMLATVASQAAASAGSPGIAGQVGASIQQSAPLAPVAPTPGANPTGDSSSLYNLLGGAAAASALRNAAMQTSGSFGQAATSGRPWDPFDMARGGMQAGFIAAGALIGSVIPGVGTLIGAGAGAVVGGVVDSFVAPVVDAERARLAVGEYGAMAGLSGVSRWDAARYWDGISTPALQSEFKYMAEGTPLSRDTLRRLAPTGPEASYLSEAQTDAYHRARFSKAAVRKYGAYAMGDDTSWKFMDEVMDTNMYDDPLTTAGWYIGRPGMAPKAWRAQDIYTRQQRLDLTLVADRADMSYESQLLQRDTRYGSPGDVNVRAGNVSGFYRQYAAHARERAALANGEMRVNLLNAARSAELEADLTQEAYFQSLGQYNQSAGALGAGTAARGFEKALYSGAPAEALPWKEKQAAAQAQVGRLSAEMEARRAAGMLSPAMEMSYKEQIAQLQQQISVQIPREREQAGIRQQTAGLELSNVTMVGHVAIETARGSGMDQTRTLEARVTALQKEKELTDQILQNSRYLTNEERLQLQTRSESLKVQAELASVSAEIAKSRAREASFATGQTETRASARLGLLEAGTSGDITAFSIKDFRAAEGDVGFYSAEIARMEKFDPDNPLIQEYRSKLAAAKVGAGMARQGLAEVPMSPQLAERSAALKAGLAISQMGMGTFGDVRENLRQQVDLAGQRVRDINAREADLRKQGITVTPAMRAELAQQRAQAQVEMASLMMQYEEGWDQRLISQVYNAPGNAVLGMSQFTHREAARAGITHRAFGGNREQTEQMRTLFPRMMGMLGSGDPSSLTDRAAANPVTINLNVKLEDSKGTLIETGTQITKTKTGTDVNVNESSRRRPSG